MALPSPPPPPRLTPDRVEPGCLLAPDLGQPLRVGSGRRRRSEQDDTTGAGAAHPGAGWAGPGYDLKRASPGAGDVRGRGSDRERVGTPMAGDENSDAGGGREPRLGDVEAHGYIPYGFALDYVRKAHPGMGEEAARAWLLEQWSTERVKVVSGRSLVHLDDARQARWLDTSDALLRRSCWRKADLERLLGRQAAEKEWPDDAAREQEPVAELSTTVTEARPQPDETNKRDYRKPDTPRAETLIREYSAAKKKNWSALARKLFPDSIISMDKESFGHGEPENIRKRIIKHAKALQRGGARG